MDRNERKEKFIELAEIVEKAGSEYAAYLLDSSNSEHLTKIKGLETQGDSIEDQLNHYFTTQRNIPYLSLDRAKLLALLDEVLDQILLGSKSIESFGSKLPDDFSSRTSDLAKNLELITSRLAEGVIVIYDDFEEASAIASEIEDIRDQATQSIFQIEKEYFASQDDWKSFIAVSRIIKRTSSIVNATKSASEMLQLMSMKYL